MNTRTHPRALLTIIAAIALLWLAAPGPDAVADAPAYDLNRSSTKLARRDGGGSGTCIFPAASAAAVKVPCPAGTKSILVQLPATDTRTFYVHGPQLTKALGFQFVAADNAIITWKGGELYGLVDTWADGGVDAGVETRCGCVL